MLYLASGCKERVGEGFESRVTRLNTWKDVRVQSDERSAKERHTAGRALACTSATGGQVRGEELDRMVGSAGKRWRACAGAGDERTRQAAVRECRCACMHADGRPGCMGTSTRARAGANEHTGVRTGSDAERLALGLVMGVLFTREHDLRPERRKST
ncbi:hypothetical protein CDL15_Pgr022321 [Punica granatum]|uniref:Uncharacterized protein n=1 Tax=Punica granatum TaxID=22663 RepID=A0A218XVS9_PUNGR|nr:hypothetical protein CDL15_Pgr022321 [Punica granatum]